MPKHRELSPARYLQAIGAVVTNFNYLEFALKGLFQTYLGIPDEISAHLFDKLDSTKRLDLLAKCVAASPDMERFKDALSHFIKGFAICAENRNIIAHALPTYGRDAKGTVRPWLLKTGKASPVRPNIYTPSVTDLRLIANAMFTFGSYGSRVGVFAYWEHYKVPAEHRKFPRRTWPKKPALPKLLSPQYPSTPTIPPRQPKP